MTMNITSLRRATSLAGDLERLEKEIANWRTTELIRVQAGTGGTTPLWNRFHIEKGVTYDHS
jgi:hypothetical protein